MVLQKLVSILGKSLIILKFQEGIDKANIHTKFVTKILENSSYTQLKLKMLKLILPNKSDPPRQNDFLPSAVAKADHGLDFYFLSSFSASAAFFILTPTWRSFIRSTRSLPYALKDFISSVTFTSSTAGFSCTTGMY